MSHSLKRLVTLSFQYPDHFQRRLRQYSPRISLVFGGIPNLGHFFWQEMSGLLDVVESGFLKNIDSVIIGPHTWLSPQQIFPELAKLPTHVYPVAADMPLSLALPSIPFRAVGIQITDGLRRRVQEACLRGLSPEKVRSIINASASHRLIWINLRGHNKSWTSQIDGYSNVLNLLQSEFGDIGAVFDGWKDTVEIRDQIVEKLDKSIPTYDTIGCAFEESVIWADHVDSYISVVGSGLVINSWLVAKSGVAHANRAHLRQGAFWNQVSTGMAEVDFISRDSVTGGDELYCAYDFDWKLLIPSLRRILASSKTMIRDQ